MPINCIYVKGEKCKHPKVKKNWFFFLPYCNLSNKHRGFKRCTLQKRRDDA